jgi:hypothetical protein
MLLSAVSFSASFISKNGWFLILSALLFLCSWGLVESSTEIRREVFRSRIALAAKTLTVDFVIFAGCLSLFFAKGLLLYALLVIGLIILGLVRFHRMEKTIASI